MTTKNFGPSTSGYLDPSGRNFETVVYEAGKPVLDRELNLSQDIDGGTGQAALRRMMPSGWISDDFTANSDPTAGIFVYSGVRNEIQMPQGLVAHVNGWLLQVANTGTINENVIVLPMSPMGAGVRRTDVLILEVWRTLLSATPSTVGKSASGRIWGMGNVKNDPTNDATLNFTDDLEDVNVGAETTKRVQIQYRLRAVSGIDIFSNPYAMSDPTMVANSVPASAGAPDGVATTFAYANQSANGDPGLWIAGDGDPSNTLGTVDGYMYSIPLMAVFRRNSSGFNAINNQNGGISHFGTSDRPDGLYEDFIVETDIVDLRPGVSPTGWNYAELLDKTTTFLLDNALTSEWATSSFAGETSGHTLLIGDEIGSTLSDGVGALIGNFDGGRRTFSDRSIYEVITVTIQPPGGTWSANATFTVDFTSLAIYPYTAFNYAATAPAAIVADDIVDAHFIGASGDKTLDALSHIVSITNLGAVPITGLVVTLDALTGLGLTNEPLYLDVLVAYPTGSGLSKTPIGSFGANSFQVTSPIPSSTPESYSALTNTAFDNAHREVTIEYVTTDNPHLGGGAITQAADSTITGATSFRIPERAATITNVLINATPVVGTTLDSTGRIATFPLGTTTSPGDNITYTYTAIRPVSPSGSPRMNIWYNARAPQASRDQILNTTLSVIPRYISPSVYTLTTGSGSQDTGYPFPSAYVQTGGIYNTSIGVFTGEHELASRAAVSVADFNATTGLLKLPTFVPFTPDPDQVIFTRASGTDVDIEGRSYFKTVCGANYIPNAYAQDFSDPTKHKVILPMICELTHDVVIGAGSIGLGVKGQLLLVLLIRWAVFDETNGVFFSTDLTQSTTVASVFRLKGNLLNRRA
jgi:hypothetical protein